MQIDVVDGVGVIDAPSSSASAPSGAGTGMTSDQVAAVFRRRMATLVHESQARRAPRLAASHASV